MFTVAVPLADLYAALASLAPASDTPYLGLFLERIVSLSPSSTEGLFAIGAGEVFLGRPPSSRSARAIAQGGGHG